MTPEQFELMRLAAKTLIAHRDAGRHCDPYAVQWAESLIAANPVKKVINTEKEMPVSTTHEPRKGSVADRAIKHVKAFGRTRDRELAEKIDADFGTLRPSLSLAIANDLLMTEHDAEGVWYSVPMAQWQDEPKPLADEAIKPASDSLPTVAAFPATGRFPAPMTSLQPPEMTMAQPTLKTKPTITAEPDRADVDAAISVLNTAAAMQAAPRPKFACGEFSDGRFVLEFGDDVYTLDEDEQEVLRLFLERRVVPLVPERQMIESVSSSGRR